jgi:adenylosuccinate synthase
MDYIKHLEALIECRIHLVSLGPERSAMLQLPRAKAARV